MWLGYTFPSYFYSPLDVNLKIPVPAYWYTNLDVSLRHSPLVLTSTYAEGLYPLFDNYNAINVDKVINIPMDYDGVMGVPVSFLPRHCFEQFRIVGHLNNGCYSDDTHEWAGSNGIPMTMVNGKRAYKRLLIKRL